MAKKAPGYSFNNMRGLMETISKKTAIRIENEVKKKTFIDTDIYMLNALLSKSITKGGLSKNRITIFVGEESVGKSYICYNIARNAQRKEKYNVIYIDTEFSIELADLEDFGIDISPERFMLIRSNKVEDLKVMLTQFLDELKEQKLKGVDIGNTIIFLDSIGQLASNKEVEDAKEGKNKADMTRAKAIKSLFRIINSDLGYLDIPMVCTNHQYMCVTEDTEILKSDGTYDEIKNLNVGELVKTLDGDKPIIDIVEYNNSVVMEIVLDDGEKITCTKNHKFLVLEEWNQDEDDACWKSAENLNKNDFILAIDD